MDGVRSVAVIGGGAAGFFAALSVAYHHPESQVVLFEKTGKLLSKVKASGGGRCNVTNACFSPAPSPSITPVNWPSATTDLSSMSTCSA